MRDYLHHLFLDFDRYSFFGFRVGNCFNADLCRFFPLPTASASVAVIHLAKNLFKTTLVGKYAKRSVVSAQVCGAALS